MYGTLGGKVVSYSIIHMQRVSMARRRLDWPVWVSSECKIGKYLCNVPWKNIPHVVNAIE